MLDKLSKMNIILSRKGFDSSYGGIPSPVIVENGDICNGKIISLPIPLSGKETPSASYNITYDQLNLHDINYFDLIDGLTKNKESLKDIKQRLVHLDPDINKEEANFIEDIAVRIQGNASRKKRYKSFSIYCQNQLFLH